MPFDAPPPFAAWQHRDARDGFEAVFIHPDDDGYRIEGDTAPPLPTRFPSTALSSRSVERLPPLRRLFASSISMSSDSSSATFVSRMTVASAITTPHPDSASSAG